MKEKERQIHDSSLEYQSSLESMGLQVLVRIANSNSYVAIATVTCYKEVEWHDRQNDNQ